MKPRAKQLLNFAFIFGTLAIVILISVNGQEMTGAVDALRAISPVWIILCTLAFLLFMTFDACSLWYFLRRSGHPISFGRALFVTITGLYYSNITPGATGGQPMQVYLMTKDGVSGGVAPSALTARATSRRSMWRPFRAPRTTPCTSAASIPIPASGARAPCWPCGECRSTRTAFPTTGRRRRGSRPTWASWTGV